MLFIRQSIWRCCASELLVPSHYERPSKKHACDEFSFYIKLILSYTHNPQLLSLMGVDFKL